MNTITINTLDTLADKLFVLGEDMHGSKNGIKFELTDDHIAVWYHDEPAYYTHKEYGQIDLDTHHMELVAKVLTHVCKRLGY